MRGHDLPSGPRTLLQILLVGYPNSGASPLLTV